MQYGIKQIGKIIFCANCGKVISQTGEYESNFCYSCGNPISMEGIELKEQEIKDIQASLQSNENLSDKN